MSFFNNNKNKLFLLIIFIKIIIINSNSDIKKSWKRPNFDINYPKFTPFKSVDFSVFNSGSIDGGLSTSKIKPNYKSTYVEKDGGKIITKSVIKELDESYSDVEVDDDDEDDEETLDVLTDDFTAEERSNSDPLVPSYYNVGPGVNVSLDLLRDIVNVHLDENCLKDVFNARGKKFDLITKILPLFILPFLIQSAIVPFLVATLKLFIVKSLLVGKFAIVLMLLSLLKNFNRGYTETPYHMDLPPYRRSEFNGYQAEGRPTTWVT